MAYMGPYMPTLTIVIHRSQWCWARLIDSHIINRLTVEALTALYFHTQAVQTTLSSVELTLLWDSRRICIRHHTTQEQARQITPQIPNKKWFFMVIYFWSRNKANRFFVTLFTFEWWTAIFMSIYIRKCVVSIRFYRRLVERLAHHHAPLRSCSNMVRKCRLFIRCMKKRSCQLKQKKSSCQLK